MTAPDLLESLLRAIDRARAATTPAPRDSEADVMADCPACCQPAMAADGVCNACGYRDRWTI